MTHSELFPVPSSPPSKHVPKYWPGITTKSTTALREVLQDNHVRWHILLNDRDFHNHSAHRAIAIWFLGAPEDVIKDRYKSDTTCQRPVVGSPEVINVNNFKNHLGDGRYYGSYLAFFTNEISKHGVAASLERYLFSEEFNIDPPFGKKKPDLFNRFLGGLLHPMIHVGYGAEFCLSGIAIEGLAETAVLSDASSTGIPDSFFHFFNPNGDASSRHVRPGNVHVFTILSRILNDPELGNAQNTGIKMFSDVMEAHGPTIIKHMTDWHVDTKDILDVERKIEEISWMNVILYAVGGWTESKNKSFNADFYLMHLVTSSIFLSSFMAYLSPTSQCHLLRGYLLTSLTWWISRGRPSLDIAGFYDATESTMLNAKTDDAWGSIIETSKAHPDDHLPKLQRTLAHYRRIHGTREPGQPDFAGTGLSGAERLDGTLFLRAANLTAEKLGRVVEGGLAGKWCKRGFYRIKHTTIAHGPSEQ